MAKAKRSPAEALRVSRALKADEMRDIKRELKPSPTGKPVPFTVRVPPDVLHGLRKAIADRLVTRQEPRSQQDIISAALRAWLTEHGYMQADK